MPKRLYELVEKVALERDVPRSKVYTEAFEQWVIDQFGAKAARA